MKLYIIMLSGKPSSERQISHLFMHVQNLDLQKISNIDMIRKGRLFTVWWGTNEWEEGKRRR
jgi:hypothetical protein